MYMYIARHIPHTIKALKLTADHVLDKTSTSILRPEIYQKIYKNCIDHFEAEIEWLI